MIAIATFGTGPRANVGEFEARVAIDEGGCQIAHPRAELFREAAGEQRLVGKDDVVTTEMRRGNLVQFI